jgi:Ankyrin repeats (3 copies)
VSALYFVYHMWSVVPKRGFTALQLAVETGHIDIVDMLLKAGADVNTKHGVSWRCIGYAECCHG